MPSDPFTEIATLDSQMASHTLVIPTYNRPAQLRRLLVSLQRQGLKSNVLVADSSTDENHALNAASVRDAGIAVQLVRYEQAIPPFDKFQAAVARVDTEYASMCADDDFLVVDSLAAITDCLRERPDCVAAHGWYYTFYETHHLGITSVVYKGSYEEPDALARLHAMCARYEAVTYAVYRTAVMADVLLQVRALPTILSKEFGAGALTMLAGKVARVPALYYGRSLGPSEQYANWHPLEMLGTRPQALFADYLPYRAVLTQRLAQAMDIELSRAEVLSDLAHLRYLCDYIKPSVIDYLFDQNRRQVPKDQMMRDVWPVLAMAGSSSGNAGSLREMVLTKLGRTIVPPALRARLRTAFQARTDVPENGTRESRTTGGQPRQYLLYAGFLQSMVLPLNADDSCQRLVAAMNTYD